MRKIVVLYILLMICIGCNSSKDFEEQSKDKDKLIGDWERYGDEFAGAMIAVEYDKESDLLQGWLTYTTDSMITWNFRCYEIKWLDIEKEKNGYSFRDMYKKKHFYALLSDLSYKQLRNLPTYTTYYRKSEIYFIDKNTIRIKSGKSTQYWKRLNIK